ncbi:MAG: DegV family protein [Chloroflexi bacterium]|nr:DegV family protein [Chloroflexota bacterium]
MRRVAIVTDSASDLDPSTAAEHGIVLIPLIAIFGDEEYRAGVDMTAREFWARLTAPGAPFPRTAAASAGEFQAAFERCFAEGAGAIVCVTVAGTLSATLKSAQIARDALPDREIHVIDSWGASMVEGLLAELAAEMADAGESASAIAAEVERRIPDTRLFLVLDTLEYLHRGGRIGRGRALLGAMLSVKPLMTVLDGVVDIVDRPRTRSRARQRLIEVVTARPVERLALLATPGDDDVVEAGAQLAVAAGVDPATVTTEIIGGSIGPHVGPGAYGAVVLWRHE